MVRESLSLSEALLHLCNITAGGGGQVMVPTALLGAMRMKDDVLSDDGTSEAQTQERKHARCLHRMREALRFHKETVRRSYVAFYAHLASAEIPLNPLAKKHEYTVQSSLASGWSSTPILMVAVKRVDSGCRPTVVAAFMDATNCACIPTERSRSAFGSAPADLCRSRAHTQHVDGTDRGFLPPRGEALIEIEVHPLVTSGRRKDATMNRNREAPKLIGVPIRDMSAAKHHHAAEVAR